ncbi:hypothetical protein RhiirA4_483516 [Rhizophagus irregularis]|uniref:Uncharacterized protein n=1 Tax=Rhizophagus irregularis TaxID=588596 RepID=A0A2I1HMP8_9GLOM|nr:hypothetical protein RhiirA4_483516 [Rhizophagus irregularis]
MVKLSGGYLILDLSCYLKDHEIDLLVSKAYQIFLIGIFWLPISWDDHHKLVYILKKGLDDTLMILEKLKKSYCQNMALHSQSLARKAI